MLLWQQAGEEGPHGKFVQASGDKLLPLQQGEYPHSQIIDCKDVSAYSLYGYTKCL